MNFNYFEIFFTKYDTWRTKERFHSAKCFRSAEQDKPSALRTTKIAAKRIGMKDGAHSVVETKAMQHRKSREKNYAGGA